MFGKLLNHGCVVVSAIGVLAWGTMAVAPADAQCCEKHGGDAHHGNAPPATTPPETAPGAQTGHDAAPPHGGKLAAVKPLTFEVVYRPEEIRVYVYDSYPHARSAKDLKGEVSLKARDSKDATRLTLQYVAASNGQQDYLSVATDLSGEKAKDLTATIELENLPIPHHAKAHFTQPVVVSKPKLQLTVAAVDKSDEAAIERQQVCPVTGAKLGSMGDPIKVLIDGKAIYLCCEGCLGKVRSDPEKYLKKAREASEKH